MSWTCLSPRCLAQRLGLGGARRGGPSAASRRELARFLQSAFTDVSHFRTFLGQYVGDEVVDAIPDALSLSEYADRAVDELTTRRMVDAGLFESLRKERPRAVAEVERVAALWQPSTPADPCAGCPTPWGVLVMAAGLLCVGGWVIAKEAWHEAPVTAPIEPPAPAPTPPPTPTPPTPTPPAPERAVAPVPVTVVLLDGPMPSTSRLPSELAEVVTAAARQHPRAILLDMRFPLGDAADYAPLGEAVAAARASGVPVMAARPTDGDRRSGIPRCSNDPADGRCFDDLLHAELPADADLAASVERWEGCRTKGGEQRRTFGFAASALIGWDGSPLAEGWFSPTDCPAAPTRLPDVSAACARPYEVIGASELGAPPEGPVSAGQCARLTKACSKAPVGLGGRILLVGDARTWVGVGADALNVGPGQGTCVPGAEAHAAVAAAFRAEDAR